MSRVSYVKIKAVNIDNIFKDVSKSIDLIDGLNSIKGNKIFLKVNLLSQEVVPGQCTSPWVFESVLRYLLKIPSLKIYFGDANVASTKQVMKAAKNWGLLDIGRKYGSDFINLSDCETIQVMLGKHLKKVDIPKILLDMDAIITLPVIKTHCITPFTGALKNQWGFLPRVRFQFHDIVHFVIAEINAFFSKKIAFGLADLTIAMEGPGPRVGSPKVCNAIMASKDLVTLDTCICRYMGINIAEAKFIKESEKLSVGERKAEIIGDRFETKHFLKGIGKDYLIYRLRDRLLKFPILKKIIFLPLMYKFLGYFVTKYNYFFWYRKYGRKYAKEICLETGYGEEFLKLIKKSDGKSIKIFFNDEV